MDSKPLVQSWTVWFNALVPVLILLVPQLRESLTPAVIASIIAVGNLLLRVFKTDKSIGSVL